ncbi:MAG: site-2 protease family protein [Myxococcota bacterium]
MQAGNLTQVFGQAIMVLVPMILSLTVHEFAHAWAARRLGDLTAEARGRLTLNPLAHADPVGTVGLPLLILIANAGMGGGGIPFFGWAKPVPTNPANYTRKVTLRTGLMLVAVAGPVSNLVMSLLAAGLYSVAVHAGFADLVPEPLEMFLVYMIQINIALFVFNMIPIYPLDGQKVLSGLLPPRSAIKYDRFNVQFGWMALMAIIFMGRDIIGVPVRLVFHGVLSVVGLG